MGKTPTDSESNLGNGSVPPIAVDIDVTTTKSTSKSSIPPLFSFQITNPITYFQTWWKKLIGNEGVKVTIQIKPVTAFILALIICGTGFGLGRLTLPQTIIRYIPLQLFEPIPSPIPPPTGGPKPSPTPIPLKETAFTGKIQYINSRYYLVTSSAEAIRLETSASIDFSRLVGKRLLVSGMYDKTNKILTVSDITSMEILSATPLPIPTIKPSPLPISN